MYIKEFSLLVSPITHEKTVYSKNKLIESNGTSYKIIKNVPIMLPKNCVANWHRELIEIILWEYPEEIEKLYTEIDWNSSPVPIYIRYIEKILHDKQGIYDSFERYSKSDTEKWIVSGSSAVTLKQRIKFNKYARKSNGKSRTESKAEGKGIFKCHPYFGKTVNKNSPETIVELGTGAGGGTAAVGLYMSEKTKFFTVDIGFECLGNAIGIGKYQKKRIIPVCANFWALPFADNSIDAVCTFNGLDESRETKKTVSEVSRILKDSGTFTVVSRKNAFMRQSAVLEYFGFTKDETVEILKRCRVYSDSDSLCRICGEHKLKLINQKEFEIKDELIFVVSEFEKSEYGELTL